MHRTPRHTVFFMAIPSLIAAMATMQPAGAWTYTGLVRAVHLGAVSEATLTPDAVVRAQDTQGVLHAVQIAPAQVAAVADRFAQAGVDLTFVPPSALAQALRQCFDLAPAAFVLLYLLFGVARAPAGNAMLGGGAAATDPEVLQRVDTTFDDVAGLSTAKEELREVVDYLRDPRRFDASGARAPRGVLLEGPPGTGKTLLARAVAGEAGVSFLPTTASSFVEMYVGLGAARVRALFDRARRIAPCVVWIDEIDAVARRRGQGGGGGGGEERETTLNELLSAMDGFEVATGVLVLAATNRADVLDDALLRAGRFDRRVPVTLPDAAERAAILRVHARTKTIEGAVDLDLIADRTTGMSGADLGNLMNEAAIRAVRRNSTVVSEADVVDALDRVVAGLPRATRPSDTVRERVAVHEAGHAIVGATLHGRDALVRVTIVPRASGAGGFTALCARDDQAVDGLYTKDYLEARMGVLMAGRAAEVLLLGADTVSIGCSGDLRRAKELARRMVADWGMGDDGLVQDDTSREVARLVDEGYTRAFTILNGRVTELQCAVRLLLEADTVDGSAIVHLMADP